MARRVVVTQLFIGWLPMWGFFWALMFTMHPGTRVVGAAVLSLRMVVAGAVPGLLVQRVAERFPWRNPVTVPFVFMHVCFAILYAVAWVALNGLIESAVHLAPVLSVGPGLAPFLLFGVWLYVIIAGVTYSAMMTDRVARAEVHAAQSQLAALRAQLNPHFLFNALHSVVQLIPREPARAASAAEQLGGLLRVTVEEDRDIVDVDDELAFVRRYLELERMRFGDRLLVTVQVDEAASDTSIPLFALQTLVENAVRHGAATNVGVTQLDIIGVTARDCVTFTVHDTGSGTPLHALNSTPGTGLKRLRARLHVLYGAAAELHVESTPGEGFTSRLVIPRLPRPA